MSEDTNKWLERLRRIVEAEKAELKHQHPGRDLRFLALALICLLLALLVSLVGVSRDLAHAELYYNVLLGAVIIIQALVGACVNLRHRMFWVGFSLFMSAFVLIIPYLIPNLFPMG